CCFLLANLLLFICIYRRDEFSSRRFESRGASPDRKISGSRSFGSRKFDDNSRQERYSDKYDAGSSKWNTLSDSTWGGGDHRSWHSNSTGYESSRIAMNSNIGSSSLSRLHPGSEISQVGGISSRGYFGSNRRY